MEDVSIDIASLFLVYVIIPFSTSLVITFIVIEIYNKLKNTELKKYALELKILGMEEQIKAQKEEIGILFSRTNHINSKLDSINSLIEKLDENILKKYTSQYYVMSPSPEQPHVINPHIQYQSQSQSQSQKEETINDNHHNSTIEYILKKLESNPLTTRELQQYIGRTREHTSRLMKKLYDDRFVDRDTGSMPFKYTITNEGRKLLIKHSVLKNNRYSDSQRKSKVNLKDELTEIHYPENLNSM
jgi:DNA-binding MarR family transcriptional regulator